MGPPATVTRYQKRISGSLLDPLCVDRLRDIEVPRVAHEQLTDSRLGEPYDKVRARVETAREAAAALCQHRLTGGSNPAV